MIAATAGHVDHGKSTLVRLLTGVDPDRWDEEQRRGLTIDLGFAWTTLPSGLALGFVDVPGHERFLRNMLAGCGAVDLAVLAVSAREGWKPQTEEHVQILDLLGVGAGLVVLTHVDQVDEELADLAEEEAADHLAGTFLAGAPVVRTAADRPASIEALRTALDAVAAAAPPPADHGRPRLWVDRSFTVAGAGRVVTGTLAGGALAVGDQVVVADGGPRPPEARVRSLRVFGQPAGHAPPGTRVAVNLASTDAEPERGQAVVAPGRWAGGQHLHVALTLVRGVEGPLRPRGAYRAFLGTAHVPAQLRYPAGADRTTSPALARLHLDRPLGPMEVGDRLILRDEGTRTTVAGAVVVAVDARPARRPPDQLARRLAAAQLPPGPDRAGAVAAAVLAEAGGALPATELARQVGAADPPGTVALGDLVLEAGDVAGRRAELLALAGGAEPAPLPDPGPATRAVALQLAAEGLLQVRGDQVVGPGVKDRATELAEALDAARAALAAADPPLLSFAELREACGVGTRTAKDLVLQGDLVAVGDFVATADQLAAWVGAVRQVLAAGPATAGEVRGALGLTRKYAIPLLEVLDRRRVTVRDGDLRSLPDPAPPEPA